MKKALSAIIALLIAFLLLSCNGQIQNKGEDNGPSQEPEYIDPPKWEEDPTENTAGSWTISSSRLDTETVMLASMDTLFSSSSDNSGKTESNTDENGVIKKVVKEDFTTTNGVTILKDSSITFTPKNQVSSASKAAKDTAEYKIAAEIKAKISSTSDSSGSTASEKKLNVSYSATTSNIETLENIKTTEIKATTAEGDELYTSTSTPTALLVKSYDQQIDDMILDYVKGNQVSSFYVDANRSFYSMGKGWIYFISYADKEYHKVNFSISSDGKIENKTFDGWCEESEQGELVATEHPAVKDETEKLPLTEDEMINLTAQLYSYFIRYIPAKYSGQFGSLPEGIKLDDNNGILKFTNFKENDFFSSPTEITGTVTLYNPISAELKDFMFNNTDYDIEIGGVSDGSYVGGQATHAYITTADGKEYSYNYLVDKIYKVCIRVYATAIMAGSPLIDEIKTLPDSGHDGVKDIKVNRKTYDIGPSVYYTGDIRFSFTEKTFDADFLIEDESYSWAQDVHFKGSGKIVESMIKDVSGTEFTTYNINWEKANLDYFGNCSASELYYINKIMEAEFSAIKK